jgi:hypothetical protein
MKILGNDSGMLLPEPKTQFWPTFGAMHLFFVLWGAIGGFLALMFTPQILLVPTLFLGGLLFFGLGTIISYMGASK